MAGYDGSIRIDTKIDGKGFNQGINTISNSLRKFTGLIATAFSLTSIYNFSKECVNEASKMQSALIGLQSIVEGQGRSFEKARSFIDSYTQDGLIPATDAITAYKNLASRGYNDDQIQKTMLALKDAAAFGRQSAYSYGEAIKSATEGLKNENSILVDNAGVTKNVAKMWDDYAKSIGTTSNNLTTQQKIQAEVNGILEETKFQTGDAAKYAATYEGQTARLSASFIKLKQNIGALFQGMFGTVITWVGKAIEGINIFIQAIGEVIAMFTGKNPIENLSSGLDESKEALKDTSSGVSSIGSSADESSAKVKKLEKQLAGFDEINKLSSNDTSSSGGSSGGGVSGGGSIGDIGDVDLDTGVIDNVSSKVKKLARQIKSFLDDVLKKLKKYEPILKGIGAMFLTAFGFKWIASAVKKFLAMNTVSLIIGAISKALNTAIRVFNMTGSPIAAVTSGFRSLGKSLMAFLKNLSPMQKFQVSLVALVGTFVTTYTAIKNFNLGTADLGTTLLNIVPIASAVGVAMYGMLGPVGLILEAITLLIAGIKGYSDAQKQMAEDAALERLFDNQGVSLDLIIDKFEAYNEETLRVGERVSELSDDIESNTETFREGAEDVNFFLEKMNITSGKISDEDIPQLEEAFENLSSSTKESIDNTVSILQNTLQTGMTNVAKQVGVDADKIIDKYIEIQIAAGNEISKLDVEYKKIINSIQDRGYATEEEQQQIKDLVEQYAKFNPEISETRSIYDDLIKQNFDKVNLGDPDKLKENINELKDYKDQLIEEANSTYQTSLNEIDKMIALAENMGFSEEYIESMEKDKETLSEALSLNIKEIESNYGGTLATVLSQIIADGADETEELKDVVSTINEELGKTGKNVDLTGDENKLFTKYFSSLQADNNENLPKIVAMLSQFGIDIKGSFTQSSQFTEEEKEILNNNFYDAVLLNDEQRENILAGIAENGVQIKDAQGNAITFTEEELQTMSKLMAAPWEINEKDQAEVLDKIISQGGQLKTAQGNAVTFTEEEKASISRILSDPMHVNDEDFKNLKNSSSKLGRSVVQSIIDSTYAKLPDLEAASTKTGKSIPVKLGEAVEANKSLPLNKVSEIVSKLNTTAENKELINKYFETGNNIDEGLARGLEEKMHIPKDQAEELGNAIIEATKKALDSHSPSRKMQTIGEDSDQGLANGLKNKKSVVINEAKKIVSELENLFKKMSLKINLPDITKSGNSLISRFQTMLNNITSGLNTWLSRMTSSLNNLYVTSDGKVGYSGISRVSIPRLAKGGIAYRPTYAMIGEAGKEAVLPLENNTAWMDTFADKLAERIGIQNNEGNIIIEVVVDGERIQKVVKKRQKKNNFATNGGSD